MNIQEALRILELNNNCSFEEAKIAHRDLMMIWHPDKYQRNPRLLKKSLEKTKELNNAIDYLASISKLPEYKFSYSKKSPIDEQSVNKTYSQESQNEDLKSRSKGFEEAKFNNRTANKNKKTSCNLKINHNYKQIIFGYTIIVTLLYASYVGLAEFKIEVLSITELNIYFLVIFSLYTFINFTRYFKLALLNQHIFILLTFISLCRYLYIKNTSVSEDFYSNKMENLWQDKSDHGKLACIADVEKNQEKLNKDTKFWLDLLLEDDRITCSPNAYFMQVKHLNFGIDGEDLLGVSVFGNYLSFGGIFPCDSNSEILEHVQKININDHIYAIIHLGATGSSGIAADLIYHFEANKKYKLIGVFGGSGELEFINKNNILLYRWPISSDWDPNCCPSATEYKYYKIKEGRITTWKASIKPNKVGMINLVSAFYERLKNGELNNLSNLFNFHFDARTINEIVFEQLNSTLQIYELYDRLDYVVHSNNIVEVIVLDKKRMDGGKRQRTLTHWEVVWNGKQWVLNSLKGVYY